MKFDGSSDKLATVKIKYTDGTSRETNINNSVSDAEVAKYFIGQRFTESDEVTFHIGESVEIVRPSDISRYYITFTARPRNAIGLSMRYVLEVDSIDICAAVLKLYESFDHIHHIQYIKNPTRAIYMHKTGEKAAEANVPIERHAEIGKRLKVTLAGINLRENCPIYFID